MTKKPLELQEGDLVWIGPELAGHVKGVGLPFVRDGSARVRVEELHYLLVVPENHEMEMVA